MSKKTINNLEEIRNIVTQTIKKLEDSHNEKEALKYLAVGIDKQFTKIVKDMGGESWHLKKNMETSVALALGEIS